MSRKNKNQQEQGYVPASYNRKYKPTTSGSMMQNGATRREPTGPQQAANSTTAQYARESGNYANRKPNKGHRGRTVAIVIVVLLVIGGVAGLGAYVYKEMQKSALNEEMHNNVSKQEMEAIDNELTGMTKFNEPFTMLLLGSDARSDDPDLGARTDTIVLCRIDPTTNHLSMVSIPRDTMIDIPGYGINKFNAAYTYGGPSGTIAAVKDLTGVDIDHFAEINFEGLVDLVDNIGGIDVMVDERIDDWEAGNYVIPEGMQHLNGEAALVFSRSRAYADGDFTRVSNQRKVIEAILRKGLEAPAKDLYGIIQSSTSFLTTDTAMNVDFIYSLADQIRHNNDYPVTIDTATIPASVDMIDNVSYVVADKQGVAELMKIFMAGGNVSSYGQEESAAGGEASGGSSASSPKAAEPAPHEISSEEYYEEYGSYNSYDE